MLFVISTNDPKARDIQNGSGGVISVDEEDTQKLDNLVKRVNEEGEVKEGKEESEKKWLLSMFGWWDNDTEEKEYKTLSGALKWDTDDIVKMEKWDAGVKTIGDVVGSSSTDEESGEKKWFFNKLFWKDDQDITINTEGTWAEMVEGENAWEKKEMNQWDAKAWDTIVSNVWVSNKDGNLIKAWGTNPKMNASDAYMHQYSKELVQKTTPMVQPGLKTAIGKYFEIGVHTLKLNNADFNQTLAYMNRWDQIKQITKENSYGCFLAEIVTNTYASNVGKRWYVCKGYLKDVDASSVASTHSTTSSNPTSPAPTTNSTTASNNANTITNDNNTSVSSVSTVKYTWVQTQIGDLVLIENSNYTFPSGHKLYYWDSVDQMTELDENGCFTAHVCKSSNPDALGHVARICMGDIK